MRILQLAQSTFIAALIPLLVIPTTAGAVDAMLTGFEAVPAISTTGTGTFVAHAVPGGTFEYTLTYSGTVGTVTQAHIHIGQMGVNGGISVFLCTNLMNGPDGDEPACPESGTVTGTLDANDIIGPSAQGIALGQSSKLVNAILGGVGYINVHTDIFPGGEIRGQISP